MSIEEENIIKNLQVKLSKYCNKISKNLSKPEQSFVFDFLHGMISSKSCILRQISQSLNENISLKKTEERLTYHLNKEKLNDNLGDILTQNQSQKISSNTLILVDPSDIIKPEATKMEGLSKVRDGNDGKWKNGYDIIDFVGVNKNGNNSSVFPIYSEVHSNEIGPDTLKNKLFDKMLDIIIYSENKGIFVMDRGFDDKRVINELYTHLANFIIRMKNNRNVIYNGVLMNIVEAAKHAKFKQSKKLNKNKFIESGVIDIEVPISRHTLKNPQTVKLKLVVSRISSKTKKGNKKSGYFYLLVNLPDTKMTEKEICKFALESYRSRWKIEEVHRQVKSDFGWEKIKLQRFNRIKSINTMLWLALSFIYSLDTLKYRFAKALPNLMLSRKNKLSELNKFIYYRIINVVKYCFSKTKNTRRRLHSKRIKMMIK